MSRTTPIYLLLLVLAAGIQQALLSRTNPLGWGGQPDLMAVVVIAVGLARGDAEGAIIGFAGGFLKGSIEAASLGSHLLTWTLAGFGAGFLQRHVFAKRVTVGACVVAGGTLLMSLVLLLLSPPHPPEPFLRALLPSAIWNGLLAILVMPIVLAIDRRFPQRPEA